MSDLLARLDRLLHPQLGLCRGMLLNRDKPHDQPEDIYPTKVGELLEAQAVLADCRALLCQQEQSA